MSTMPVLIDAEDAKNYYSKQNNLTDAERCYVVATLAKDGYSNKKIRETLGIEKVYTLSHLLRVGMKLSEDEFELWHKNPVRITLGHLRSIIKLPSKTREEMLRGLLLKKMPVRKFELIAKGEINAQQEDTDISRYETIMSEVIGRQVKVRYNKSKQTGTLTLSFYGLDDLDTLSKAHGFAADQHI